MPPTLTPTRLLPLLCGAFVALVAGGIALAPADEPPRAAPPAPSAAARAEFAGSAECERCHGEVHATWAASTHALTLVPASESNLPTVEWENGQDVLHGPGRTKFVYHDRPGFEAETLGPDGKPTRYRVTHAVGKTRIQMLIATLPDGRMQVLPSMRERGNGEWFDYTALFFAGPGGDPHVAPIVRPGDPSFWTGPVRSWDSQCSRCHESGREAVAPPVVGAGPRHRSRALGLDCESCHGPGAAHAVHHDQMLPGTDPLVRLRALPRRQQVDACLVCHMEADEIVPGYRPGEAKDLLEFLDPSVLDDPDRVDPSGRPLELVYAGVSFWGSRCAEEGGLTCATCHDPHGGPHRAAMRTAPRADAQCAKCHAEIVANPQAHTHHDPKGHGGRCVNCHMPLLTVERGHGAVTDHSISIPRPHLKSDRVARDACIWCHAGLRGAPEGAPPFSEIETRRTHATWWPKAQALPAWLDAIARGRSGAVDAPSRLNALLDDPRAPRFARATAPVLLARLGDATRASLVARAKDADSLVRRRVADALPQVPTPDAWAALVTLLDDPSRPVQAHAARAALTDAARLAADKPALARALAILEQETRWVIDDDLRWQRLAQGRYLAGDAAGAAAAVARQAQLDPTNESLLAGLPAPREDAAAVLAEAIRRIIYYKPGVQQVVLLDPFWKPEDEKFEQRTRVSLETEGGRRVGDDTWSRFVGQLGVETRPPASLDLGVRPVSLTRSRSAAIFDNRSLGESWSAFYEQFPGAPGMIAASPVAFNAARTEALLWISLTAGSLEARGALMVLEKRNGQWRIVTDLTLYIS